MNILISVNNTDVTADCVLADTRIAFDSTKRITTASFTIMGQALNAATLARYDSAHYDQDVYGVGIRELYEVTIYDGRDGTTKLFDGNIYAMTMKQSDTPVFSVFYQCDCNDFAAWLDRSICWDSNFKLILPNSDQYIINMLLGHFCLNVKLTDIAELVPTIQNFDWLTKTCRQVLDDLCTLSMGEWRVDFDGNLHYGLASAAPSAPFGLSTSPDHVSTFPVKVDGYKHDFTNPINTSYVRGAIDATTGVSIEANYSDPVSVQRYGTYESAIVDTTILTGWDAALRAKSTVLTYAYPLETGNFTIWGPDGLACGQQVHIHEDSIGIDGDYIIRSLTMQWIDQELVQYTAAFGAAQPDLETILRLLNQRTAWATANKAVATPAPGSVTDASIAQPGLSSGSIQSVSSSSIQGAITAGQIGSVNATAIMGQVSAGQIGTVNAGSIVGQVAANQIGSINATVIQGQITAGQIGSVSAPTITGQIAATQITSVTAGQITGQISSTQIGSVSATSISGSITAGQIASVNATTINGVVVSSQLADQIIDNLAKYATALTPIQMVKTGDPWPPAMPNKNFPANSFFYYQPDGHFYQVNAAGTAWAINDNPQGSLMSFYYIGSISATSITGLIAAGQIGSITAGQLTGQITSSQIASVTAGQVTGQLTASQIGAVNASTIAGQIAATQIASLTAGQITGSLTASQIGSVNASVIAGTLSASQIGSVNASVIQGQISNSQITSINANQITGSITASQIGTINAATITIGTINDSQIGSISGTKLIVGTVASDKLTAYSVDVGGAANMPGRVRVYNANSVVVAQLGNLTEVAGGGNYGGWFQTFGAGGTGYSSANLYTDINGNAYVRNSNFTITNGSDSITMTPQTFDATYSSLAVKLATGSDNCSVVSRGIVVYEGSTQLGFLVRDPSNPSFAQIGLYSGGATNILLTGTDGRIRGVIFQCQGNPGVTENVLISGTTLHFAGGIYIGHT
jgi:hypothetical protein